MKPHSALLPLILAVPLFAQTPATPPSQSLPAGPTLPAGPAPQTAPATAPSAPADTASTLQARSNLVVLDVVVTDKNHNPVHGLKLSDFTVRDSGAPQTIKSLEEHSPDTSKPAVPFPALPPGVYTNFESTPADGPLNLLLLDRLNTPLGTQSFLHDQLVSFVRTMKPGTRVAIFGLTTHLILLQGFTTNPALLLAALEGKKTLPGLSPLLNTPAPGATGSTSEAMNVAAGNNPGTLPPALIASVQQFETQNQSFQTQLRVKYTLDAINALARYLSGLPGRKNLIWFSGSFPLSILPDGTLQNPFAAAADMQDQFRDTTNLLTHSQVAVYPVDARGIQSTPGMQASDDNGARYTRTPAAIAKDRTDFSQQTAEEHSTMLQMATDTGGQAFVNTNGLADAVAKAISLGSSYYTITYTPTDIDYDGSFRKLQVSADHPGLELSYRRGYYADLPGVKSQQGRKQLTTSPLAPSPQRLNLRTAMLPGSPLPTQILVKAYVVPAGPPTDDNVATDNVASPDVKGPFRKYTVNYAVAPQDLSLKTLSPGKYLSALEFVVFVYDRNNNALVNTLGQSVHANLTADDIRKVIQTGLQFHQLVSVPAQGDYFLRIGVRDLGIDRMGGVEVPIDAVKNLAVVEPLPPQRKAPSLTDLPK